MPEQAMDAITLLKDDHKKVKELFRKFEGIGERGVKTKDKLADGSGWSSSSTPRSKKRSSIRRSRTRSRRWWRRRSKSTTSSIGCPGDWDIAPEDDAFDAKMTVLIENVEHHADEEEERNVPRRQEGNGHGPAPNAWRAHDAAQAGAHARAARGVITSLPLRKNEAAAPISSPGRVARGRRGELSS